MPGGLDMQDPKVAKAVKKLRELVEEINELNVFLAQEGVHYSIAKKQDIPATPAVLVITHLNQTVKY